MEPTAQNDSYSLGSAFMDIFVAPGKALEGIQGRNGWLWAPLIILMAASIAVFGYYFSWVDFDWYKDFLIDQTVANSDASRSEVEQGIGQMQPGMMIGITSAAIIFMTFLFYALQAAYFLLVNKLTGDRERSFGDWFAMTTWVTYVTILNLLATVAVIVMADSNQLPPTELVPLSLNSLFFGYTMADGFMFKLTSAITIIHVYLLYLMALGYSKFADASLGKGFAVATPIWVLLGLAAGVMGG